MIKQLGRMQRPDVYSDLCDLCGQNFKTIKSTKTRGDSSEHWEQTIIRLEYTVCPSCFFDKVVPKLHEIGLPKKDMDGMIA